MPYQNGIRVLKNLPPHNNGMHPTRDTTAFMFSGGSGGRVMPGVRPLVTEERSKRFCGPSLTKEKGLPLASEAWFSSSGCHVDCG
jgi:hypothetical protein